MMMTKLMPVSVALLLETTLLSFYLLQYTF